MLTPMERKWRSGRETRGRGEIRGAGVGVGSGEKATRDKGRRRSRVWHLKHIGRSTPGRQGATKAGKGGVARERERINNVGRVTGTGKPFVTATVRVQRVAARIAPTLV